MNNETQTTIEEASKKILSSRVNNDIDDIQLEVVVTVDETRKQRDKEKIANTVAISLIAILAVTILPAILAPFLLTDPALVTIARDTTERVLITVVPMVGMALAYYFGKAI